MRSRVVSLLISVGIWICADAPVYGVVSPRQVEAKHTFPVPKQVSAQVVFWEKIFTKYSSSNAVIHDVNHPHAIIDVIDFKVMGQKLRGSADGFGSVAERGRLAAKYIERYQQGLARFKAKGKDAAGFGAIEKRLYDVYSRDPLTLRDLYMGRAELRSQTGLADEFERAADRAQRYLPQMEAIFKAQGLPTELTRIAFVESMFNIEARSRVGASGLWQFMPATARSFMSVNRYVDERNAPLKATRGAARMLAQNYRMLGSWPLAVTAYNHGPGGMARAVRMTGTNDFDAILRNYKAPSFRFASKNFYGEFLAAKNSYAKIMASRGAKADSVPSDLAPVIIAKKVTVAQLLEHTPLDRQTLQRHNPCLLHSAFGQHRNEPLPANYQIYVPKKLVASVERGIGRIKSVRVANRATTKRSSY